MERGILASVHTFTVLVFGSSCCVNAVIIYPLSERESTNAVPYTSAAALCCYWGEIVMSGGKWGDTVWLGGRGVSCLMRVGRCSASAS